MDALCRPCPPVVADEEAYVRYCDRLGSTYGHLVAEQRAWFGFRELARWINEAIADQDGDRAGRLIYCFDRLEADWDVHVKAEAAAASQEAS
jgi:hypothetical protein